MAFVPWPYSIGHNRPNWSSRFFTKQLKPSSFLLPFYQICWLYWTSWRGKSGNIPKWILLLICYDWIIFIWYCIFWPLSYFCLTWTRPSKNSCNSLVCVAQNHFGMWTSVRLKQSWIHQMTKFNTEITALYLCWLIKLSLYEFFPCLFPRKGKKTMEQESQELQCKCTGCCNTLISHNLFLLQFEN